MKLLQISSTHEIQARCQKQTGGQTLLRAFLLAGCLHCMVFLLFPIQGFHCPSPSLQKPASVTAVKPKKLSAVAASIREEEFFWEPPVPIPPTLFQPPPLHWPQMVLAECPWHEPFASFFSGWLCSQAAQAWDPIWWQLPEFSFVYRGDLAEVRVQEEFSIPLVYVTDLCLQERLVYHVRFARQSGKPFLIYPLKNKAVPPKVQKKIDVLLRSLAISPEEGGGEVAGVIEITYLNNGFFS